MELFDATCSAATPSYNSVVKHFLEKKGYSKY